MYGVLPSIMTSALDGTATLDWSNIVTALSHVWDIVGSCVNFITTNEVFVVIFGAGLIPLGFKIFKKAKKAVK